jgi:hypothetical protein|tara:strand:- start:18 stop:614 length:597 start_codon:yes stop_codon:yes gene_type:complete
MRRVCIVGAAGPSNRWANDLEEGVELWAMNLCHRFIQPGKATRWFQMHPRDWNKNNGNPVGHFGRPMDHEEFLQSCGIPVYMQEADSQIPTSVRYPLEEITKKWRPYFTSTVPYMIALALHEGVDEIGLLGIYLNTSMEYQAHRPCVEYWLGVADGMGVQIWMPEDTSIAEAPLYAYTPQERTDPADGLTLKTVEVVG